MERQASRSSSRIEDDRSSKDKREKQDKKAKSDKKKEKKEKKEKKDKEPKEKSSRRSNPFGKLKDLSKALLYEEVMVEVDENGNERPLSAEAARAAKEQQMREQRKSTSLPAPPAAAAPVAKPAAPPARPPPPVQTTDHDDQDEEDDDDDDEDDDESSAASTASSRSRTHGGREVSATLDASDLQAAGAGAGRSWAAVAAAEEQWQAAKEREAAAWRSDAAALVFLLPDADDAPASAPAGWAVHDPLGVYSEAQVAAAAARYRALPAAQQLPGSLAVSSDDFNAVLFLAQVHQATSWPDLVRGAEQLERRLQEERLQLKTLANDNFDEFLLCKDTVDSLHAEIREAEMDPDGPASTLHIERTIEAVRADAGALFEPLLELRREADKVRRTLQLLHKYRFLLRLPAELDRGLRRGDPEAVVADYRRALALRLDQVPALRPVWQLVSDKLAGLQRELLARLDDPLEDWDQQRRTIRLLLALAARPHPVTRFLAAQQAHLCAMLDSIAADPRAEELTRVKLVKKLTKVVLLHVPDLARLVQALAQDQASCSALAQLAAAVAERYSDRVREALALPPAASPALAAAAAGALSVDQAAAFADCITVVRGCDEQLTAVGMRAAAVEQLVADASAYLIEQLCSQMVREASLLYVNEDWQPRAGARSGGATALPEALELLVCETVRDLRSLVPETSPHQARVFQAIAEALRAFTDTLHHLAFELRLQGPQAGAFLSLMDAPDGPAPPTLTPTKQLLVVAANCRYTRTSIVPHILATCQKDLPAFPREARAEELEALCAYLEQLIAGRYVAAVSEELAVGVQRGVEAERGRAHPPAGPSSAASHALVRVVLAFAELQALAPFLLPRCVPQLYDNLLLCLVEAVSDAGQLTREAVLQVELDHAYITEVLRAYASADTAALSKSLRSALRRWLKKREHTAEELERNDSLLKAALASTSGLFLCFSAA